jgi:hypothetical protein
MAPSLSLMVFIELFLKPVYDLSHFLIERDNIRVCRPLNKVLFENRNGLEFIYNSLKGPNKFLSKKNSNEFITKLLFKQCPIFTPQEIHKHFVYSLEIIQHNDLSHEKYFALNYVEYLEFLCRIATRFYD